MFDIFQKVWSFVFSDASNQARLVSPAINSALRATVQREAPKLTKPRSILRKQPRANFVKKSVSFALNDLQSKHRRRAKRVCVAFYLPDGNP